LRPIAVDCLLLQMLTQGIAAGKRYQRARSKKTLLDRPSIRTSVNRSQPMIKRRFPFCAYIVPIQQGGAENFAEDLGEAVGEPVEASARRAVGQRATEHLQHMLSREQRIDDSIEASSKACGRHLGLGNKMPRLGTRVYLGYA
jgi:hypothetical protein